MRAYKILYIGMIILLVGNVQANDEPTQPPTVDPGPARARIVGDFPFNFNPPGARSLGMGASFIGLADDATASEANPAGLTTLTAPEFSVNLRLTESENHSVNPFPTFFDEASSSTSSTSGLSFVSYVHPFPKKGATLSIYAQQAANGRASESFRSPFGDVSLYRLNLTIDHVGLSGAFRLGQSVAVGASLRYSRVDLDLTNQFAEFIPDLNAYLSLDQKVDQNDDALTFNLGLLFNSGEKFSVGLVYKNGADFELDAFQAIDATFLDLTNPLTGQTPWVVPLNAMDRQTPGEFTIPSSIGAGFVFRPSSNWCFALDLIRIQYSDTSGRNSEASISNETEMHVGVEYGLLAGSGNTPLFLRAGFYTNPDHDGNDLIDSERQFVTFGAGVFLKNKLQLDAAIAVADENTETLISMVWRL